MAGELLMDDPVAMMMVMTVTLVAVSIVNLALWISEMKGEKNVDK
jgi:hypothetical protein